MLSRLARLMIRRPLGTLAALAVAGAWSVIAVNAMLLQKGPHPAPLLGEGAGSRLAAMPAPDPSADPARRVNAVAPGGVEDDQRRREAEQQAALVGDIQAALSRRNFYQGAIDGVYGPRTEAAIRDYERAAGIAETGEPSEELLAHVRLSTLTAPPIPVPSPLRSARQVPPQETVAAAQPSPPPPAPAPIPVKTVTISGSGDPVAELLARTPVPPEPLSDGRIEAVQRVLAELGYAPGSIDGHLNAGTRRAIEDFQIDRGLPVTGDLSPRFLDELSAVSGVPLS